MIEQTQVLAITPEDQKGGPWKTKRAKEGRLSGSVG